MLINKSAYRYEIPYKGLFDIMQCWTNSTITFQTGATKVIYNMCRINTYKSKTNVNDFRP